MIAKLVLVGGFLGSGKTTLLAAAARLLADRGVRAGLVTNDQAPGLVDTALLARAGVEVQELSGSCFCCAFDGFLGALEKSRAAGARVILAEPVGSCTDLSATLLQPLKAYRRNSYAPAPLTVLADPFQLAQLLSGGDAGQHPDAAYILRKQLEEADRIVVAKADLLGMAEREALAAGLQEFRPGAEPAFLSAATGEGVAPWLDAVLADCAAGTRLAVVDYDRYARGEALLGWVNARYALSGAGADWDACLSRLMDGLALRLADAAVGHVKCLLEAGGAAALGNLTGAGPRPLQRGRAGAAASATLTVNARAGVDPERLAALVREEVRRACTPGVSAAELDFAALSPGRPRPTHRFTAVV